MPASLTPASSQRFLQLAVFALVSAAFTNIYLTQPVLPVLQQEFGVSLVEVSFTVSAVVLGIAIANLPFGLLVDRFPIKPIIFVGGSAVAIASLVCAITTSLWVLVGARFVQGLFIPALTTCIAAYLSKTLPQEKLSVVLGSYVSATVLGGLSGRLIGGWLHPPLHWRYAFVTTAILTLVAMIIALRGLPAVPPEARAERSKVSYLALLKRWDLCRLFCCAAGSFAIFSSIFNYLPYRLSEAPFHYNTSMTTALYLVYVVGIFIGPIAGKLSNRFGSATTLMSGSLLFGLALLLLLVPWTPVVILALLLSCAGFFGTHSAAVGAVNSRLTSGQGRANALYVLFYYVGGWIGITLSGLAYEAAAWNGVIGFSLLCLLVPLGVAWSERKQQSVSQ